MTWGRSIAAVVMWVHMAAGSTLAQRPAETGSGDAPLRLDEVLASLERHHPLIEVASAQLRGARGDRLAARGAFDPSLEAEGKLVPTGYYEWGGVEVALRQRVPLWGIEASAGWRMTRGDVPDYYGERVTLDGGELRAEVRVPLWRDGPIDDARARIRRGELSVRAQEAAQEERLLSLQLDAAAAYWSWVFAGRRLRIADDMLRLAEVRDRQVAARISHGALPAIEALETQRAVAARRTTVAKARRELERASITLSLFYRHEDGEPKIADETRLPALDVVSGSDRATDLDAAITSALATRPELRRLRARGDAERVSVELAGNRRAPRVDVGVAASVDVGDGTPAEQEVLSPPVLEGTLRVVVPLRRRTADGELARSQADLAAVRAEARWMRDRIAAQVRDAQSAMRAAEERIRFALDTARAARAVADAERQRFELGVSDAFDVNLREEAAAGAELAVAEAWVDLLVARARWRLAMGRRLDESN